MDSVAPQHDVRPAPDPRFFGGRLLDLERGLVSRRVFADEAIYQQEMEKIFHQSWLFLAHASQLPRPGDFVTTYMGEDPVVVWRDVKGKVHAFLNTCPHRGNKLALYDKGKAASLICSYHGWTFNSQGQLTGVPFFNEAYYGELDRACWGLVEVPGIVNYGGFFFGNWHPERISFDDFMGELKWWWDRFMAWDDEMGGHEMLPGIQKWRTRANWKFPSDNAVGDHYHAPTTHFSAALARGGGQNQFREESQEPDGSFVVSYRPGHGTAVMRLQPGLTYQQDLEVARRLGSEAVAWVEDWHARLRERLKSDAMLTNGTGPSHLFPNLTFYAGASALGNGPSGTMLYQVQPKGVRESEFWGHYFVPRGAPEVVRRYCAARATAIQGPAGLIGLDDGENYDRMVDNMHTPMGQRLTMNYVMTRAYEGSWKEQERWQPAGLAGQFGPRFSEHPQRQFYRFWAQLMELE
jgi:phenylpropionate dioxygenase-like ring-hydroxylating dioxygenase large terminal subunit